MKSVKKILLPIDLDQPSREAMEASEHLASRFGSEILLTHVIDQRAAAVPEGKLEEARALAMDRLHAIATEMRDRGFRVEPPIVSLGNPYEQIIACAESHAVNVIVTGPGNRNGAEGVGSTTEQLVRRSAKPVWIARPGSPAGAGNVLCAVDFSEASARALRNAVHLARSFEARLTILHVLEAVPAWLGGMFVGEYRDAELADARSRLTNLLLSIDHEGVSTETLVLRGKPASCIVETARDRDVQLIIMGSSGRTGLDRLFLGSASARVLRALPCSMVLVKSESVVRPEFDTQVREFEQRFQRGVELSRAGFAEEALEQFRHCLDESPMSPHVWLAMAKVHEKTGNAVEARHCLEQADLVRTTIERQRIEAEVRRDHWLTSANG
jgi:nucleotide-binding universal stress UspA family protein